MALETDGAKTVVYGVREAANWTKAFIDDYFSREISHEEAVEQLSKVLTDKCYRKLVFRCDTFAGTFIMVMGKKRIDVFIRLLCEIDPERYATITVNGDESNRGGCIA